MLAAPVIAATIFYALLGIVVFVIGFLVWDRLTPVNLWKEVCGGNVAIAVLAGSVAIALGLIIAAAIHG